MASIVLFVFALYGLLIGSFLNVCVYRIPRQEDIVHGRSYCPTCKHTLSALDLIPVLSFLALRGRCRYCKSRISIRYLIVEVISSLLFLFSAALAAPTFSVLDITASAVLAVFFSVLLVWSLIKWDENKPPSSIYYLLFLLAVIFVIIKQRQLASMLSLAIILPGGLLLFYFANKKKDLRRFSGDIIVVAICSLLAFGLGILFMLLALVQVLLMILLSTGAFEKSFIKRKNLSGLFILACCFLSLALPFLCAP